MSENSALPISIKRGFWSRIFFCSLELINDNVNKTVIVKRGKNKEFILYSEFALFIKLGEKSLVFNLKDKKLHFLHLKKKDIEAFAEKLNYDLAFLIYENYHEILNSIVRFKSVYLKDSQTEEFLLKRNILVKVFQNGEKYLLDLLTQDERYFYLEILKPEHIDYVKRIRTICEDALNVKYKEFFENAENYPLTVEQRLAVIRNNDYNLILAAAGTGKTSVIVAKALYLVVSKQAQPKDILILAYNKNAAEELRQRIKERAEKIELDVTEDFNIFTFHALGRSIIQNSKERTYLTKFEEDPKALLRWVDMWLYSYLISDPQALKLFLRLFMTHISFDSVIKRHSQDLVETKEKEIFDEELRTLNNELVKSKEEQFIANWLFLHSVPYKYEDNYVVKQRVEVGFDYRPDFHILNTNIYLEHFGIDREGNTRSDIDKETYNELILKKRELHKKYGTVLLETYSYDFTEKMIESRLHDLLVSHGVKIEAKSSEEIIKGLKKNDAFLEQLELFVKCLKAIRVDRISEEEVVNRYKNFHIPYPEYYGSFFNRLVRDYCAELEQQHAIDFDDMILKATDKIKSGTFISPWKYILIDEFQDISLARLELIKQIIAKTSGCVLNCVGDDWQAIYHFSGGKLEVTTRFSDYIGTYTLTKLEKTYRYNSSIALTVGAFIQANPEQFRKDVKAPCIDNNPHVHLLDCRDGNTYKILAEHFVKENKKFHTSLAMASKAIELIKDIKNRDPKASVAILARYNFLLTPLIRFLKNPLNSHFYDIKDYLSLQDKENIHIWTFHRAKGLEADYCILLGFSGGKFGFPSRITNSVLLDALMPQTDPYPYSEERRLFYVALTRAKKDSYIVADPLLPSVFVNEILSPKYHLDIQSSRFAHQFREIFKCPFCKNGYYELVEGRYGPYYRCTSGVICSSQPRVCEICGAPSIDKKEISVCKNPSCRHAIAICALCGRKMVLRQGPHGKFWGCTGYGLKQDPCKFTQNFERLNKILHLYSKQKIF